MKRGRPKGYNPYTEISYEDLADWVGRKTKVPVSKKWLQSLMGKCSEDIKSNLNLDNNDNESYSKDIDSKIEYTLTNFNNE
mgnify:CR=1 FL=1|jgi:hypothetical protein